MSKGFWRFLFWFNILGITDFFVRLLILRMHQPDINFVFAFINVVFTWKIIWPKCEFSTTWYRRLLAMIKWRIHRWKSKK